MTLLMQQNSVDYGTRRAIFTPRPMPHTCHTLPRAERVSRRSSTCLCSFILCVCLLIVCFVANAWMAGHDGNVHAWLLCGITFPQRNCALVGADCVPYGAHAESQSTCQPGSLGLGLKRCTPCTIALLLA